MIKDNVNHIKKTWLEMGKGIRFLSVSLVMLVMIEMILFVGSYERLGIAIQNERIRAVQQISGLVSEKLRLLYGNYETELLQAKKTIVQSKITSLQEAHEIIVNPDDYYVMTEEGACVSLQGKPIVFSSKEMMKNLHSQQIGSVFSTVQGMGDFWIFGVPLDHVTLDGQNLLGLLKLVSAQEYADITATSLYDDLGVSYVVNSDGVITLRPNEARADQYFQGYNLLQILEQEGVDRAQSEELRLAFLNHKEAEIMVTIQGHTWLIQSFPDEENFNIVLAIPISITAHETFTSMRHVITMVILTMITLSAIFMLWIFHYMSANQKMQVEQAKTALKSDFMNKVSHDIRTPLNAIVGMLELSQRTIQPTDPAGNYLQKAKKSSEYLISIVNDVLDMSRIEAGKMRIASEPFDMAELLDTTILPELYPTKDKQLNFSLERPASIQPAFLGDALRIKQCLINLISNAVKFTADGGTITLRYMEGLIEEGLYHVHFTVIDNGIGMSEEFMEHMFKPFEQAESSLISTHVGSGLGLSIVHNFVTLMNGTIDVKSKQNVGTKFTITLPLQTCAVSDLPHTADFEDISSEILKGKRVLLAEDNELNREIIVGLLTEMGLVVDSYENGAQAVEAFTASTMGYYALILMDIQMPVMNGLEAAAAIRKSAHVDRERIPIIALSANAFDEDVERSLSVGMQAHLTKPIDVEMIKKILHQYIC